MLGFERRVTGFLAVIASTLFGGVSLATPPVATISTPTVAPPPTTSAPSPPATIASATLARTSIDDDAPTELDIRLASAAGSKGAWIDLSSANDLLSFSDSSIQFGTST